MTEPAVWPKRSELLILVALRRLAKPALMPGQDNRSREVIFGSRIAGAKIRAEAAPKRAAEAVREAEGAEARSIRMQGYGGLLSRRQRSRNVVAAVTDGFRSRPASRSSMAERRERAMAAVCLGRFR